MRSRSPLLASSASKPTVALLQDEVVNSRVGARIDTRDMQDTLSSNSAGSVRSWQSGAIVVQLFSYRGAPVSVNIPDKLKHQLAGLDKEMAVTMGSRKLEAPLKGDEISDRRRTTGKYNL